MIRLIGLGTLLLPCMITDIRRRELPVLYILVFSGAALTVNLLFSLVSLPDMLFGAFLGGVFFCVAAVAGKGLGPGDGILILGVGIFCGGTFTVPLLLFTFLLTVILGGGYLLFSGRGLKARLPLAPFMGLAGLGQCAALFFINGAQI